MGDYAAWLDSRLSRVEAQLWGDAEAERIRRTGPGYDASSEAAVRALPAPLPQATAVTGAGQTLQWVPNPPQGAPAAGPVGPPLGSPLGPVPQPQAQAPAQPPPQWT